MLAKARLKKLEALIKPKVSMRLIRDESEIDDSEHVIFVLIKL